MGSLLICVYRTGIILLVLYYSLLPGILEELICFVHCTRLLWQQKPDRPHLALTQNEDQTQRRHQGAHTQACGWRHRKLAQPFRRGNWQRVTRDTQLFVPLDILIPLWGIYHKDITPAPSPGAPNKAFTKCFKTNTRNALYECLLRDSAPKQK